MGEDVSDMATTTSQLQAKLLALTGGKVDIMLDANTFKSSTQILREMSAAFEDMTDIQRASALELMGGKRQANILSALIENFDTVESAIEASAESAGSAIRENERWMDSINGKVQQFNNATQTMWNNAISSDVVKDVVDLGTELVKIVDKLGLVRTTLFGVMTYMSVIKKDKIDFASILGIHDVEDGWIFGKDGISGKLFGKPKDVKKQTSKIENQIDNVKKKLQELHDQPTLDGKVYSSLEDRRKAIKSNEKEFDKLSKKLSDLEAKKQKIESSSIDISLSDTDGLKEDIGSIGDLLGRYEKFNNIKLELPKMSGDELIESLNMINIKTDEGIDKLMEYSDSLGDDNSALQPYIASLNGGKASLGGFNEFLKTHNAQVQASGIKARAAAIGHGLLNAAISMGASVIISFALSAISDLINRHEKLAEVAKEAVDNYQSATSELKDHYKTIEEIKGDYAKLAKGVDELGRNVSLSTEEYERYNEITNKIADMFPNMVSGYTEEGNAIIALKGNVDALTESYENAAQAARDEIIVNSDAIFKTFRKNTAKASWSRASKTSQLSTLETLLNDPEQANAYWKDTNSVKSDVIADIFRDSGVDFSIWDTDITDLLDDNNTKNQLLAYYRKLKKEVEAEVNPVKSLVNAYLYSDKEGYQKLSDEGKNIAQAIISGFDTEFYNRNEFKDWTDIAVWIDENVVQKLQNSGNMAEFTAAFDLQTQFNNGKIEVDDYIDKINEFATLLEKLGFDEEIIKTVKAVFNVDDYETKKNSTMDIVDSDGDSRVGTLSKEDLDIIDKNKTKWQEELAIDGRVEMTWDELIAKIAEAKEMAWSAGKEFEKISESIDSIQSAYSTLNDVVTEYNENGFLSLDNLQALLSLEPQYLACLQMENGQLSINQEAMQNLVQARLAESKATVIQSAMDQLHALAARTEADAVTDSANAASNAVNGLGSYASALGIVSQDAIKAAGAVTAFNSAVAGAKENKFVDQSEIDAILDSMNTSLTMIDELGSSLSTNFNQIMGSGKSDTSTGGGGGGDSALEQIQNKYKGQISNLENQQTYLQNEIEKLEAEDKAVSRSYYDEQIKQEEKKLGLYKTELVELKKLYNANPTQETADALWEVEHALQESVIRASELRKELSNLYVGAFDKLIEAYDNSDDFYSDQQNYIDKYQELMELQGNVKAAGGIQEQIKIENRKMTDNVTELEYLKQALADGIASGAIKEGSEQWVDLQDKIRAAEEAVLDNKISIEQYRKELNQLSVDAFETVREAFANKDNFLSNQQDYIQGYADLLEGYGVDVPEEVYQKLIDIEKQKRANNIANLADARQGFAKIEEAGYTAADEEWQSAYQKVVDIEKAVQDNDISMAEWAKTIRELDFEKFDRFMSRLGDIRSEIDNIRGLFDGKDVANEDGTLTKEGIASLGLAVQGMTQSQSETKKYAGELASLGTTYEEYLNGLSDAEKETAMSEKDWYDRRRDLNDSMWDSINTTEDYKDAIIDMKEAQIDALEEGYNKEIEAMSELIELRKEELDAQRDLYDFNKKVKNQKRELSEIDRRIASLSGSTADADIAELRKLQAERRELQEGLDDTYYQHSKDSQSKALDDELEMFQKIREDYIEEMRETLEDTATVIANAMAEALANADVVYEGLTDAANEYGFAAPPSLMAPWVAGKDSAKEFKETATDSISSLIDESGIITVFGSDETKALVTGVFGAGTDASDTFKQSVDTTIGNIKTTVENSTSPLTSNLGYPWEETTKEGGPIATFSNDAAEAINGAVSLAEQKSTDMLNWLSKPWDDMIAEDGPLDTFSDKVHSVYGKLHQEAIDYVNEVNSTYDDIKYPDYNPPIYGGSGNESGEKATNTPHVQASDPRVKTLQEILNGLFFSGLKVDGLFGNATKSALKNAQKNMGIYQSGKYDSNTRSSMITFVDGIIKRALKDKINTSRYQDIKTKIRGLSAFAKGTLGTKKDQLAITDESWIGEEITLAAGKNGQLQYLKKGSAVMPADISTNLVEWGKLNPNMMAMTNSSQGVNLMSNYVNKPELNLSFEALVKAQNITEETLPAVKKLVTEELDKFTRKLNYAIKRA